MPLEIKHLVCYPLKPIERDSCILMNKTQADPKLPQMLTQFQKGTKMYLQESDQSEEKMITS